MASIFCKSKVPGGLNGLLSGYLTRKRVTAIYPYLKGRRRICDVGCGVFIWQNALPHEVEYVGIDRNKAAIEHNQNNYEYRFLTLNIETDDVSSCGHNFDLIIMAAMIEHLRDPRQALSKLRKMLSPAGIVVITTPHPIAKLVLSLGARLAVFAGDKHTHNKLLNLKAIKQIVEAVGYKLIRYERFLFGFNQLVVLRTSSANAGHF